MRVKLIKLVAEFEGFERRVKHTLPPTAVPYLCPAGFWTIGYGHLCKPDHPPIDQAAATAYLVRDLETAARAVDRLIPLQLGQGQRDALTSWTMNLGAGRLRGSTLRSTLLRGDYVLAPAEIRKWVYAGGRRLPGLALRREVEARMFEAAE